MLSAIDTVVPVGRMEWDQVLFIHNRQWAQTGRTVDALRRKFARMHSEKAPTGNPFMSPSLQKAKRLREKIIEASETVDTTLADEEVGFFSSAVNDFDQPTLPNECVVSDTTIDLTRSLLDGPRKSKTTILQAMKTMKTYRNLEMLNA
eukprot:IDg22753t1